MHWEIRVQCKEGKQALVKIFDENKVAIDSIGNPNNNKLFAKEEIATILNMAREMNQFGYTEMDCRLIP